MQALNTKIGKIWKNEPLTTCVNFKTLYITVTPSHKEEQLIWNKFRIINVLINQKPTNRISIMDLHGQSS